MNSENELPNQVDPEQPSSCLLQKFKLYETRSNYYMIGRDKSRTFWRVLKIDRLDPSELNILEDPATYTDNECYDLLKRIHEGNKSMGGLKFITICYGIVGFVKFLGPYYILIITKRRKVGAICGHAIYTITKSEMIPVPNPAVRTKLANSKNENRYKKLLCTVDLTKDFFFSYSYHVMSSLQKNLCDNETGPFLYEKMFVWNEYLTREIRSRLNNTLWTVALVYGFFKQVNLSVSGRNFKLALISRRSRHFAGTRYLKRGVNEKGRVANDVETEQVVTEDAPEGCPMQISSVVQNRGSIPLFWSQETSRLNIKPDIILSRKDHSYEATRLHFENLVERYGDPIIILNLIKTCEKKPRETILRTEFANAITFINKSLTEETRLRFLHWDLHKHARSKSTNVLAHLGKVAATALGLTGIFYGQVTSNLRPEGLSKGSCFEKNDDGSGFLQHCCAAKDEATGSPKTEISYVSGDDDDASRDCNVRPPKFQKGVLRTNCIDCLDRTNVAQYAYGLVALGHQLHALGFIESPDIDLDNPLAEDLMRVYEAMGDTLALQYGGSAAHNKIFSETRGQWKAATQSQEFLRTLQRFYSNAYMDAEKQDAINVFLGNYQPLQGKPALWELDADKHYNVGRRNPNFSDDNVRSFIKRSLSDGNILSQSDSTLESTVVEHNQPLSEIAQGDSKVISESAPAISTCETGISCCSFTPPKPHKQIFDGLQEDQCLESDDGFNEEHDYDSNFSNFLNSDWLSSSGNSCEEDTCGRSTASLSSENLVSGSKVETSTSASESGSTKKGKELSESELSSGNMVPEYSKSFMNWVANGELLFL